MLYFGMASIFLFMLFVLLSNYLRKLREKFTEVLHSFFGGEIVVAMFFE